jgi:3-mercaptopyruvate sulfurtransferase SseA
MLAIIVLAACNSKDSGTRANSGSFGGGKSGTNQPTPGGTVSSTPSTMSDGVRRVTIVELRDMLDKGTAIVIDTRGADSYKASHIKGSISVPVDQVANRINDLPRDKTIVAYCS